MNNRQTITRTSSKLYNKFKIVSKQNIKKEKRRETSEITK